MSVAVAVAALAAAGASPAPPQPNLLFMMADQMRFDRMGCSAPRGSRIETPSLDRLASKGVRFAKHYSSTPTCTPARAAILTGQKPWNHGMLGYGNVATSYPFEMPTTLRSAGYFTASVGKDHFSWNASNELPPLDTKFDTGNKGTGVPHGYERLSLYDGPTSTDDYHQWFARVMPGVSPEQGWPYGSNGWEGGPYMFNESLHPTTWVGQQAVDFITDPVAAGSAGRPWFLKVSFHRPHSPYDPPQRWLDRVNVTDLPAPVYSADGWDDVFRGGPGDPPGCGPSDSQAWCGAMPPASRDLGRRAYQANIMFVDEWVGKILDALNATGAIAKTFIIWTADHGDGQEDHYHYRKGFPYELSAHIPLLFYWPTDPSVLPASLVGASTALRRGGVIDTVVTELRDVFPTFLDAINGSALVPPGHPVDGGSLICLVRDPSGESCKWREWLDLEHATCYNNSNHWSALTDGKMKYVFNACNNCGGVLPVEQLFNLSADPHETLDVATKLPEVTALWRGRMARQFLDEGRGPEWVTPNGTLLLRDPQLYSPNYPGKGPTRGATCTGQNLTRGQTIVLESAQHTKPINFCQDFSLQAVPVALGSVGSSPRVLQGELRLLASWGLCLGVMPGAVGGAEGAPLALVDCDTDAQQHTWSLAVNNTSPSHVDPQPVARSGGGAAGCVAAPAAVGGRVTLAACDARDKAQQWVFGTGGRLCVPTGCVSVEPAAQGW